jgi:DNA-directed RNA polymerase subunit M/transcription elongation factor TFIIS
MLFCPNCDNVIIPRKNKWFCRICNKEFDLDMNQNDFKIIKTINHNRDLRPIIITNSNKNRTIADYRKAREDYFGKSEESGY